ncbi:MAG TPA: hypothetical protein VJ827_01060 [Rubrobacter sp.]|nr:hypothetical protein [Rubrobacter sp.]
MHAMVVDLRIRPVDTKEMVRVYRNEVVPMARDQRGFKGALLLTDPQTGVGISITLWDTDRHALEGFYDEKVDKFASLLTETPIRKHYDLNVMV